MIEGIGRIDGNQRYIWIAELWLCVPKTLSVLFGGGNHVTSADNDRAAMFCP
jgi:hypothetical protein